MKFLRVIFTLAYLFSGGMLLYAFAELMLINAWINLFEIQIVAPKSIQFIELDRGFTDIRYEFEYNNEKYVGSREVHNELIEERLPKNEDEIEISFNTRFPSVNFLDQLGLKTRNGNVGLVISGFFLIFFLMIDLIGNKEKWLRIYGLNTKNKG